MILTASSLLGVNMRKKVDDRIRSMIQNGVKMKYRSFFVIIGDKARDQVIILLCLY